MPASACQRNQSLDLLKAVSIFMVIFYHNIQLNPDSVADNLAMLLPTAAVPCFFMASGAVFFHRPFSMEKHLRRMLRLYLVMTLWKAIYLLLYWHWGAPATGSLRTIASYLFLFQEMEGVSTGHFWFMEAMLTVMFAAPVLYLCFHSKTDRSLLVFLLASLILFNQLPAAGNLLLQQFCRLVGKPAWDISALAQVNPFSFRHSNYFTYYLLGGLLFAVRGRFSARAGVFLSLGGLAGLFFVKYLQTGSFLWNGVYLQNGYYLLSTMALACGLFVLALRLKPENSRVLSWLAARAGTHTLGVFYLHMPVIFLLTPALFVRLQPYNGWLLNTAETVLIAAICLGICLVGKKIPGLRLLF